MPLPEVRIIGAKRQELDGTRKPLVHGSINARQGVVPRVPARRTRGRRSWGCASERVRWPSSRFATWAQRRRPPCATTDAIAAKNAAQNRSQQTAAWAVFGPGAAPRRVRRELRCRAERATVVDPVPIVVDDGKTKRVVAPHLLDPELRELSWIQPGPDVGMDRVGQKRLEIDGLLTAVIETDAGAKVVDAVSGQDIDECWCHLNLLVMCSGLIGLGRTRKSIHLLTISLARVAKTSAE